MNHGRCVPCWRDRVWCWLHAVQTCFHAFSFPLSVSLCARPGAGVAQAVYSVYTGWTTGWSGFDPRRGQKDFSYSLSVQTGSGAHPASCTMGTGGPFPGSKSAAGAWRWPLNPHLVPRSRMSRSYTSSPPNASMACRGTALPLPMCPTSDKCTTEFWNVSFIGTYHLVDRRT
jgi:hypothetical protein